MFHCIYVPLSSHKTATLDGEGGIGVFVPGDGAVIHGAWFAAWSPHFTRKSLWASVCPEMWQIDGLRPGWSPHGEGPRSPTHPRHPGGPHRCSVPRDQQH